MFEIDAEEVEQLFLTTLKGKNFMTPNIIEYGNTGNFLYELSEGTGMSGQPIYGVTVLELLDYETEEVRRRTDMGQCHDSLEDARDHIDILEGMAEELSADM